MNAVTGWVSGGHFEVTAHRLRVAVEGLECHLDGCLSGLPNLGPLCQTVAWRHTGWLPSFCSAHPVG